jgi:hypothetical protein
MEGTVGLSRYSRVDLNNVIIGLVSGLIAGIVAGIGARLAMRFVAIAAEMTTDFTLGGTLFILILGAIAGAVFGLIFTAIGFFVSGNIILRGLIYGIILAVLLVFIPFLNAPEGELTFVSPAMGIALFAPIPIVYGLILGLSINRFDAKRISASQPIRVHIGWLLLIGFGLILLLMNIGTLMGENFPLPTITRQLSWRTAGISTSTLRDLHGLIIIGFSTVFALFVGLVIVFGDGKVGAFLTAAALLAFGAAFFGNGTALSGPMRSTPAIRYIPSLITTIGFMALILLMYLFPDGRFKPFWTKPLAPFWLLVAVVWFFELASDGFVAIQIWPEWLQFVLMASALLSGLIAQISRYLVLEKEERLVHRWALIGFAVTIIAFIMLWLSVMVAPDLKARVSPKLDYLAAFAFGPYLLLWLVLPASLMLTYRAQKHSESAGSP